MVLYAALGEGAKKSVTRKVLTAVLRIAAAKPVSKQEEEKTRGKKTFEK